jgi:hypothetical protein
MKKIYANLMCVIVLMLLFGMSGNMAAQNLLTNGDLETWEGDSPTGWTIQKDGISVAHETTIVHGGTSSAAVTITGDRAVTDFGQAKQFIADSGSTYIFSVWAYHTEGTNFFAWVVGKPGGYNFSSSSGIHTDNTIVNEWQEFTWQWECLHTDTVDVFFRSYNQDGFDGEEVMYLDDAMVTKVAEAEELLENPDFEIWENDSATGWDIIKEGISVAQETEIVHGGSYSAAVTITGDRANTDFGQEMNVVVDSGMTYNLSVWAYHTEGTNFFAWVIGRPGGYTFSSSSGIHTDNTIVNEWQEFTWQWECLHSDTVNVFFRSYNQEGFDGEEVMYLDDASVKIQTGPTVSTDATLSDLTVEGETVEGFNAGTKKYTVYLPQGFTEIPVVDAVTADENATYEVFPATDLQGDSVARTTRVVVTAEDEVTTVTYYITFVVVTGIDEQPGQPVMVYPVPAGELIHITRISGEVAELSVYDITGRKVRSVRAAEKEIVMDISDLQPGYYFIHVDGRITKFIKR